MKGYDYSEPGEYFVTICTKGMKEWFGDVRNGKMILNEVGDTAYKLWREIPIINVNAVLDEFEVMPNHLHGIIGLTESRKSDDAVCKSESREFISRDANIRVSTMEIDIGQRGGVTGNHNPMRTPACLSNTIRWFKGRSSFEIHKILPEFAWHPRFYDHIVRNEKELEAIREYIRKNPSKWEEERNNPNSNSYWMD